MPTMHEKIILTGASAAWIYVLEDSDTPCVSADLAANRFKFDNIADAKATVSDSSAPAGSDAEKIEIPRADGALIQFNKDTLKIKGEDESIITDSESGGGDEKDSISFSINEADMDSASWAAFLAKLQAHKGRQALVCIALGYNSIRKKASADATKNAAGFAFLIANVPGFEHAAAANTPVKVTLTFPGTTLSTTLADAEAAAPDGFDGFTLAAIAQKGLKDGNGTMNVTPPALAAADVPQLLKGQVLFK